MNKYVYNLLALIIYSCITLYLIYLNGGFTSINFSANNSFQKIILNSFQNETTLFCLILSTNEHVSNQRVNIVFNEWAYKCDEHRFILRFKNESERFESILNNSITLLQPKGLLVDSYSKLSDKVFHMLIDTYKYNNNYDWYLKADDDTFVFVDNLKQFLSNKNSNLPIDFGYDFKVIVSGGYHSGGAGYVLSKGKLNILYKS
jgi:glycoprotein-N-acetylgalactosamine 3-beta-galactosyltransferase